MTRTVLLTGANGFVGRTVARVFRHDGWRVLAPARTEEAAASLQNEGFESSVVAEFTAQTLIEAAGAEAPDVVVHLAASGVAPSTRTPRKLVEGHSLLTISVLQACAEWRPGRVLHTGSWSEYARPDEAQPLRESHPIDPGSAYGIAKASATRWARYLAEGAGLQLATLRLFNVYGPGERRPRLLPTLFECARTGEVPSLTTGRMARDFVFVGDVAEAFLRVAKLDEGGNLPHALNVCTGVGSTVREVTAMVAERLDAPHLLDGLGDRPDRPDEPNAVVGSPAQLEKVLGWKPSTTVEEGIERTRQARKDDG